MSLDGAFIRHLCAQLRGEIVGARINKIYQPTENDITFYLRKDGIEQKLVISANAQAARINLTNRNIVNPETPTAFCMFLRSRILSAKIISIEQKSLERVVCINLETKDEMGDLVRYKFLVEIMGKYSNIILVKEDGIIADAIKRVNDKMSSKRVILPGVKYVDPPSQNKISLLEYGKNEISDKIFSCENESFADKKLSEVIVEKLQGISKVVSLWLTYEIGCDIDTKISDIGVVLKEKFKEKINFLADIIKKTEGEPYLIEFKNGKKDISFLSIKGQECKKFGSFSELIDEYYERKIIEDGIKCRCDRLIKYVKNLISSKIKKMELQQKEIITCSEKDKYRLYGDILISNIHMVQKGEKEVELINFFSEKNDKIKIELDDKLSAIENANRYYKKYKKYKNAQVVLKKEIEISKNDILYLESVLDSLERAESENEVQEIQNGLCEQGYAKIKSKKRAKINKKKIAFIEYNSPGGYKIKIGRNCKQNEELTYKMARKKDLWFHVKDIPGSHTVMFTNGNNPKEEDLIFAAQLCAFHSKARNSKNVSVDYTNIANVKKPSNYKQGLAIYKNYKTICVDPKDNK